MHQELPEHQLFLSAQNLLSNPTILLYIITVNDKLLKTYQYTLSKKPDRDYMQFKEVIAARRSVRNFIDTNIEDDKIEYVLECARQAPSWANTQCWRFIVIQKQEMIQEIAKASVINRWLKQAPCIIVACADTTSSGNKNTLEYYAVDVAIAFEHLILAATDVGLGTCWIGEFNEKKIKEILGIPPRIKVLAMTPIGYPTKNSSPSDKLKKAIIRSSTRKSLAEFVHKEKW